MESSRFRGGAATESRADPTSAGIGFESVSSLGSGGSVALLPANASGAESGTPARNPAPRAADPDDAPDADTSSPPRASSPRLVLCSYGWGASSPVPAVDGRLDAGLDAAEDAMCAADGSLIPNPKRSYTYLKCTETRLKRAGVR